MRARIRHRGLSPASGVIFASVILAAGCSGGSGGNGAVSQGPVTTTLEAAPVSTAFTNGFSGNPSDIVIPQAEATPNATGLRSQLFASEIQGTIRVFDLPASGATVTPNRSFNLEAAPFAPGAAAAGDLQVRDERLATVTSSGNGQTGEAVYLFDPRTAASNADVSKLDLSALTVTLPAPGVDSAGNPITNVPINFVGSATAVTELGSPLLFIVSSNFVDQGGGNLDFSTNNPGTVLVADLDVANRTAVLRPTPIATTDYNPTIVETVRTASGAPVVLVVNTGTGASNGPSSIDVIDPATLAVVANFPLGATRAGGQLAVTVDKQRAFVGGGDFVGGRDRSEIYQVSLANIEAFLGSPSPFTLTDRVLNGAASPIKLDRSPRTPFSDFISSLAVSPSGNYLYAINFNASYLYVIEITAGLPVTVQGRQDMARGAIPENFVNNAQTVVVRPGLNGVDYTGPNLYVATVNYQDAVTPANFTALEAVTTDKQ